VAETVSTQFESIHRHPLNLEQVRMPPPNLRPGQTTTVRLTMHASRGIAGRPLLGLGGGRASSRHGSSPGAGAEAAVAPITVSAVAGATSPAVTG
jgi:hypothetical protein